MSQEIAKLSERMPSEYERKALRQIQAWKYPLGSSPGGIEGSTGRVFDVPLRWLSGLPGLEWLAGRSMDALIPVLNDLAQSSLRGKAVCMSYRKQGFIWVESPEDVQWLDLQCVDEAIRHLHLKYSGIGAVQGAAAGSVGFIGVPPDIVAPLVLSLRAIGDYGTHLGFDMSHPQERLFALSVLDVASSRGGRARSLAMSRLGHMVQELARNKAVDGLERVLLARIVDPMANALGMKTARGKVLIVAPLVGAIVGGSFNAYHTRKVCEAAFYLYRERFLLAKYGPEACSESMSVPQPLP